MEAQNNKVKKEKFFFHGILKGRYKEYEGVLYGYRNFYRGFSTFCKEEGASFVGVIAEVPVHDFAELDRIEGTPEFYVRRKLPVHNLITGELDTCWVYQQKIDYKKEDPR